MYNAFFKARPRLRAALFGLAVCTPSLMIGVTAALAETPGAVAPAFASDRLSVEVVGRGPDVILIPGYGCSREVWRATADRLKATHRVHLVQLAGFAGQPWTHGDGPLLEPAVEALELDLLALEAVQAAVQAAQEGLLQAVAGSPPEAAVQAVLAPVLVVSLLQTKSLLPKRRR